MTQTTDTAQNKKADKILSSDIIKNVIANVNYCYNCNRCNQVCPVSYLDLFYPRNLITDLTFLSPEEALKNNNIWDCLTCGLCTEYCPMTKGKTGVNFTLRNTSLYKRPYVVVITIGFIPVYQN